LWSLALRSDGVLVHFGSNFSGQGNVPSAGASPFVAISAGDDHGLALRANGSIAAWGSNSGGQLNVPAPPAGAVYTQIAAGGRHSSAVLSNGGARSWGQIAPAPAPGPGLSYAAVAAGYGHSVALLSDGSAIAWGANGSGQCNLPALPPGMRYLEVSAGDSYTLLRRSDGALLSVGVNDLGELDVPALPPGHHYASAVAGRLRAIIARVVGPAPEKYCASAPSVAGCAAQIDANGQPNVAHSTPCVIEVSQAPAQRSGIIYFGLSAQDTPWCSNGSSRLCVRSPIGRTSVQNTGGAPGSCNGTLRLDWRQLQTTTSAFSTWTPGAKVYLQGWYRDPGACKSSGLSAAIELVYAP
jgi:alpha-tubulin suppressor-like RCC1 family protein